MRVRQVGRVLKLLLLVKAAKVSYDLTACILATRDVHTPVNKLPWLVRYKVLKVRRRGRINRAIRCWIGLHNPSSRDFWEEYELVIMGGECTRCGDPTWRDITMVGEVRNFSNATKQQGNTTEISFNNLETRLEDFLGLLKL